MITSLLALVLASAPDSAGSIDSLAKPTVTLDSGSAATVVAASLPDTVAAVAVSSTPAPPPLSAKALDSLALERVAPLPPAPAPVAVVGTKAPRPPVGLGFRVLGSGLGANFLVGNPEGGFGRLVATGSSTTDDRAEISDKVPGGVVKSTTRDISWEGQIQVGKVLGCRGPVCALGSVGLLAGIERTSSKNLEPFYPGFQTSHERIVRYGGIGVLGLRWEILEGFSLTSDLGFHAAWRVGVSDGSVVMVRNGSSNDVYDVHARIDGFETSFRFLGAGLDAWF